MRQRIVIVGAGLGSCVLAHALASSHDFRLVEQGVSAPRVAGFKTRLAVRLRPQGDGAYLDH